MPCGNNLLCHVSQFWTSLTIIMNDGNQISKNKFYVKKTSWCHMSDYNRWMTINDIMGAIIMDLHSSWKWVVLIELQCVAQYVWWIATLQFMQFVH